MSLRVSPDALVGRQLRVYWEVDDAWFAGSVESFDERTARHRVSGWRPSQACLHAGWVHARACAASLPAYSAFWHHKQDPTRFNNNLRLDRRVFELLHSCCDALWA